MINSGWMARLATGINGDVCNADAWSSCDVPRRIQWKAPSSAPHRHIVDLAVLPPQGRCRDGCTALRAAQLRAATFLLGAQSGCHTACPHFWQPKWLSGGGGEWELGELWGPCRLPGPTRTTCLNIKLVKLDVQSIVAHDPKRGALLLEEGAVLVIFCAL